MGGAELLVVPVRRPVKEAVGEGRGESLSSSPCVVLGEALADGEEKGERETVALALWLTLGEALRCREGVPWFGDCDLVRTWVGDPVELTLGDAELLKPPLLVGEAAGELEGEGMALGVALRELVPVALPVAPELRKGLGVTSTALALGRPGEVEGLGDSMLDMEGLPLARGLLEALPVTLGEGLDERVVGALALPPALEALAQALAGGGPVRDAEGQGDCVRDPEGLPEGEAAPEGEGESLGSEGVSLGSRE